MAYTTINKSTDYFNTKLYSGNGSTQSITGVGFQPDWVWTKQRSGTEHHNSNDAVRGATKVIFPNLTNAEQTVSNLITGFVSDGFSVGDNAGANNNGSTYASWNWKAGGSASSNTDGSITSSVSANTTAGFSIVSYTGNATDGATVGHGLGAVPDMLIGKDLSDTSGWGVWHKDLTNAGYKLSLNTTDGQADDSALFGGSSRTAPTSSVFTLGSGGGLNGSNANIVYAFTSITGYSKFGSYTGNGNADGSFCYLGFKPAWVMLKKTNNTESWLIMDNKRQGYNPENEYLIADLNNAEGTPNHIDLLSNGFKLTSTGGGFNGSGDTFIYMAFGQSIVGSNNVPCTAR